jgi:hypothetical protein
MEDIDGTELLKIDGPRHRVFRCIDVQQDILPELDGLQTLAF